MSPTSSIKEKQFAFILTDEEHRWLHELAEADGRSAAGWIRFMIRQAHEQKFEPKPKKKSKR